MIVTLKGIAASKFEKAAGTLVLLEDLRSLSDAEVQRHKSDLRHNYIVLSENFYPSDTPYMLLSRGIVSLFGGILSHAALVAREFGIPAIVGVYDLTDKEILDKIISGLKRGKHFTATLYGDGTIEVRENPKTSDGEHRKVF